MSYEQRIKTMAAELAASAWARGESMSRPHELTLEACAVIAREADERIAELERERDDLAGYYRQVIDEPCPGDEKHCTCVPALRREIDAAREQVKVLREALKRCGAHRPDCAKLHGRGRDLPCSCGLDTALAQQEQK